MRVAVVILVVGMLIAAGYAAVAYRPAIDSIILPSHALRRALVALGAQLAPIAASRPQGRPSKNSTWPVSSEYSAPTTSRPSL